MLEGCNFRGAGYSQVAKSNSEVLSQDLINVRNGLFRTVLGREFQAAVWYNENCDGRS